MRYTLTSPGLQSSSVWRACASKALSPGVSPRAPLGRAPRARAGRAGATILAVWCAAACARTPATTAPPAAPAPPLAPPGPAPDAAPAPATARRQPPPLEDRPREPLRAAHAAVASDHALASAAGVELLRAGGNAADAACAVALALGVVNPHLSGIGGGGLAMIYVAKTRRVHAIDFRETAPAGLDLDMLFKDGKPQPDLLVRGGLAAGVPGEVAGLGEIVRRFGKRSFADCVRPAERLARDGFPIPSRVAGAASGWAASRPEGAAFLGKVFDAPPPYADGQTVRRPALAATLAALAAGGPRKFYAGPIATAIARALRDAGGVMSEADLLAYQVKERAPLRLPFRGATIYAMPPPSSGGIVIAEALGVLATRWPGAWPAAGSADYLHAFLEAEKHGFADRARHLGDTDFVKVPMRKLLDPTYHRELAARVRDDATLPLEEYGLPGPATPKEDGGTSHLSVIDAEGNAIALTTTVNLWFGAMVIAGDTGIIMNNQMDDFSLPDTPNRFGLYGTERNEPAPRKRPLSSMSPTLVVRDGAVKLAVGGAGGPRIISGTLQVLLNVLVHGMDAQAASNAPRVHHQWKPDQVRLEAGLPDTIRDELARRGHNVRVGDHVASVNVVVRTPAGLEAAAEVRSGGAPAGY